MTTLAQARPTMSYIIFSSDIYNVWPLTVYVARAGTCRCSSLVPRPLPVSNVARKKREGLVREVTCTSFRWKGDYRAWAGD